MTSGRPPDAAVLPRAGAFVPPAVAPVGSLPVTLVFVGTVLLSVVLRWCCVGPARRGRLRVGGPGPGRPAPAGAAAEKSPRRATVSHCRDKAPRATLRGRAATAPSRAVR